MPRSRADQAPVAMDMGVAIMGNLMRNAEAWRLAAAATAIALMAVFRFLFH